MNVTPAEIDHIVAHAYELAATTDRHIDPVSFAFGVTLAVRGIELVSNGIGSDQLPLPL